MFPFQTRDQILYMGQQPVVATERVTTTKSTTTTAATQPTLATRSVFHEVVDIQQRDEIKARVKKLIQWVLQIRESLFFERMGQMREFFEFPYLPFQRATSNKGFFRLNSVEMALFDYESPLLAVNTLFD